MNSASRLPLQSTSPRFDPPLRGIRVLDMSRFISGPYSAQILLAMGADVVKLEKSNGGDDTRRLGRPVLGTTTFNAAFNWGKRSVAVDFRTPEGQETVRKLAARADVLVENFRPGTLEEMGCGWNALKESNSRLILASISGFGSQGGEARKACFDGIAQARAGLMALTGAPDTQPQMCGTFVVDYVAAIYAALHVVGAIAERHRTGVGRHVQVSLMESALSLLMTVLVERQIDPEAQIRFGNRDRYAVPGNTFATGDGQHVHIVAATDGLFARLVAAAGLAGELDDPVLQTNAGRVANREKVEGAIARWCGGNTTSDIIGKLEEAGVPVSKVAQPADVLSDPLLSSMLVDIGSADKPIFVQSVPTGGIERFRVATPPPLLGADNEAVLKEWLG